MSGLFRRLAERACGQRQPLLHARVLPVFLADDGVIEDPPFAPTSETVVAPALSRPAPQSSVNQREQALAAQTVAEPQAQPPTPRSVAMAPNPPAHLPIAETHTQGATPTFEPKPASELPPSPLRQPTAEWASSQPNTPLLMPTPARTEPARPSPAIVTPPPAATADEIHVHIGRIEVTAVREAAPTQHHAKQSAHKPQPTLSLDDYLAKRRGQSRGEPS